MIEPQPRLQSNRPLVTVDCHARTIYEATLAKTLPPPAGPE